MRHAFRYLLMLTLTPTLHTMAETVVYIGTYTRGESQGIYQATFDARDGSLSAPSLAVEASDPSFLAISRDGEHLYSVAEIADASGDETDGVSAFRIHEDKRLELINSQPSGGRGPCYVSLDTIGNSLFVASYGSGSVSSYAIEDDGSLSPPVSTVQHQGSSVNPDRQRGPHAHSASVGPDGRRVYVADLGIDQILIYSLNGDTADLQPNDPPFVATQAGGGPRHLAFHPSGKFAFVNLELSSEVTGFYHDSDSGALVPIQTLPTLPKGASPEGNTTAEILVHPSGKFLYVSNRGHDSIACYAIDPQSGELAFLAAESSRGKTPRNFGIDPSGAFLLAANQNSDNVVVFRISPETGLLTPTGSEIRVPSPVCVRFLSR